MIFNLSSQYSINSLCIEMHINRSGFYKWLKRRSNPSQKEINRTSAFNIFKEYHDKYPSHGYRWLNEILTLFSLTIMLIRFVAFSISNLILNMLGDMARKLIKH